jgi:hypothetical protein
MTAGDDLRANIGSQLDLEHADVIWLSVLEQACGAADTVQELVDSIAAQGSTIVGSKGQPAINPLVPELRQQRLALTRLLQALGTSDTETTSQRQSRTARKRWEGKAH